MPRRKVKIDLTLFPFLSVLSGLIAVMVLLMIVTVSTRVLDAKAATAAGAGGGPDAAGDDRLDPDEYKRLSEELAKLERTLRERELTLKENLRLLDELSARAQRKLLDQDATGRRAGVHLGEPKRVRMTPFRGATDNTKTPVFIEVGDTACVVHPGKTRYAVPSKPEAEDRELPDDLKRELERIVRDPGRYPLLLIHTHGYDTFLPVVRHIVSLRTGDELPSVGWEPFAPEWLLVTN